MRRDAAFQGAHGGIMRDLAESDDGFEIFESRDRRGQELTAGIDLGGGRLVFRRHAPHRIGDRRRHQLQAVVPPGVEPALGEAVCPQSGIEQVAREVAGEGPAGSVGAAQAGRQPDDEKPDRLRTFRRQPCVGCPPPGARGSGCRRPRSTPVP